MVRISDGRIAAAMVSSVSYLNWSCRSQILCKSSEGTIVDGKLHLTPGTPRKFGLVSLECLISRLRDRGWSPLRYTNTYRMILTKSNETQAARIWVRKNGVDLQLLADRQAVPRSFSKLPSGALSEGRLVRHYLSHTTFNLFEDIVRFAEAFEGNACSYDCFFTPMGTRDRRSEALKEASVRRRNAERQQAQTDGGSDDWQSDWCDGMHAWYDEMMERD